MEAVNQQMTSPVNHNQVQQMASPSNQNNSYIASPSNQNQSYNMSIQSPRLLGISARSPAPQLRCLVGARGAIPVIVNRSTLRACRGPRVVRCLRGWARQAHEQAASGSSSSEEPARVLLSTDLENALCRMLRSRALLATEAVDRQLARWNAVMWRSGTTA